MQRYAYDGVQPSDSISGPTCTNRAAAVAELRELRASILVYVQINLAYCAMLPMLLMLFFRGIIDVKIAAVHAVTWPQLGNIPGTSAQSADQFRIVTDYFYPEYVFLIPSLAVELQTKVRKNFIINNK